MIHSLRLYDPLSTAVYESFSTTVYDSLSTTVYDPLSTTVYDPFSTTVYDSFSTTVYDSLSTTPVHHSFSTTVYDSFSTPVHDSFSTTHYNPPTRVFFAVFEPLDLYDVTARQIDSYSICLFRTFLSICAQGQRECGCMPQFYGEWPLCISLGPSSPCATNNGGCSPHATCSVEGQL